MNEKDRVYNTPRVWYGVKRLYPEIEADPESLECSFMCWTDVLLSREDMLQIFGSHYNETPFDPYGHGDELDRSRYRPIGLNRTQNLHIR